MDNLVIEELNSGNVDKIQELYQDFTDNATSDYHFELAPLDYNSFKMVVDQHIVNGFVLFEDNTAKGFLLYVIEAHNAVELNMIYIADDDRIQEKRGRLLQAFLDKFRGRDDWNVISYPMLGKQETFVKDIVQYGFKLTGQAVVKFRFNDPTSTFILKSLNFPDLLDGYEITSWEDRYFEDSLQIINDAFKNTNDALYDPRFLTISGCGDVVYKIVAGIFGEFLPQATTVLLYNKEPVGVCFVNLTDPNLANVPLIGVKKGHKNKGLGKYMLRNSVNKVLEMVKAGSLTATAINAGVDTDNWPAIRMYRKIGFKEDYTYPHAYFKNPAFKGTV